MEGRRVYPPDGCIIGNDTLERGDYALFETVWAFRSPEGTIYVFRRGDPAVQEHEDGTVTMADRLIHGVWTPILGRLVR